MGNGRSEGRLREGTRESLEAGLVANESLVHWTVKGQGLGGLSYQDAVQEGRIGLWKALERYDPQRGKLSGYAVVAIRRAVWDAVGRDRPERHERLTGPARDEGLAMAEAVDRATERVMVEQLVASLPERLRLVMVWRYGLDGQGERLLREIGEALGVTKQRAEQMHAEALLALADPAPSEALRRQMGRLTTGDYRTYLARRRAWQRRTGSRR